MIYLHKKVFISVLIISFGALLFANDIDFHLASSPKVLYEQHLQYDFLTTSTSSPLKLSTVLTIDYEKFNVACGIRAEQNKFDVSAQSLYAPVFFNNFRLGPQIYLNYHNYKGNIHETNLLAGVYFCDCLGQIFKFAATTFYHRKDSFLPYVNHSLSLNSFAMSLHFDWVYSGWKWNFSVVTFNLFDYYLFFSPVFETYAEYSLSQNVLAGIKFSSLWMDMITISACPTTFSLDFYYRIRMQCKNYYIF